MTTLEIATARVIAKARKYVATRSHGKPAELRVQAFRELREAVSAYEEALYVQTPPEWRS